METSDLYSGLNPRPPALARAVPHFSPAKLFWIIKNGIKMTAMPAWGQTNDDASLWDMVAFLEKLPSLIPAEYQAMKHFANQSDKVENNNGSRHMPALKNQSAPVTAALLPAK